MIRTALCVLMLACAFTAPSLADAARVEALSARIAPEAELRADLYKSAPAAPADAPAPGDALLADLTDFALAARALSQEIEESGGPQDLRCIFRGMSGDVTDRITALDAAQTRADLSRAYTEIARLAGQAQRIASDPELAGETAAPCGAD
ncbi:hypothetical protein ACWCOP_02935 [Maricaulaceae bacterium MS644]